MFRVSSLVFKISVGLQFMQRSQGAKTLPVLKPLQYLRP